MYPGHGGQYEAYYITNYAIGHPNLGVAGGIEWVGREIWYVVTDGFGTLGVQMEA